MASEMNSSMHSRRLQHAQGTPEESEFSNFECFQNYTAPEVFVQGLAGIVNQGDVELMIRAQKQMLQRFEKTNEMLLNCNALSAGRLKMASEDFKKHMKLLGDMKKDLDYIFRKIRTIKTKLSVQYPNVYAEVQQLPQRSSLAEEANEDDGKNGNNNNNNNNNAEGTKQQSQPPPPPAPHHHQQQQQQENPKQTIKMKKSIDKSLSKSEITIDYVQMEHSPEYGNSSTDIVERSSINTTDIADIANSIQKRCSIESNKSLAANDNSNESSDCTSDTT